MSSTVCDPVGRALALPVLLAALIGCGGAGKGAGDSSGDSPRRAGPAGGTDDSVEASEAEAGREQQETEQIAVTGTKGRLEPQQIQAGVASHAAALQACYDAQVVHKKFVSGKLTLGMVVAKGGQVARARIAESDVGDWTVERCVLAVARKMTFASPEGGDGEAQVQVTLNFASGGPALETWPQEQIAAAVQGKRAQLEACDGEAGGAAVNVTLYVGNRGQVKAVGFASAGDEPVADAWAECAARAVSSWTLPDPRGKIVKASFAHGSGPR
jgi:hypothetical protein